MERASRKGKASDDRPVMDQIIREAWHIVINAQWRDGAMELMSGRSTRIRGLRSRN